MLAFACKFIDSIEINQGLRWVESVFVGWVTLIYKLWSVLLATKLSCLDSLGNVQRDVRDLIFYNAFLRIYVKQCVLISNRLVLEGEPQVTELGVASAISG